MIQLFGYGYNDIGRDAIEKVFAMTNEEKEKIVNSAHEVINKNYTISEVGKKIVNLIKNIA